MKTLDVAEELLDMSGIAREKKVSRQAVDDLKKRGKLPEPDYTANGKRLWKRATLKKAGIL